MIYEQPPLKKLKNKKSLVYFCATEVEISGLVYERKI